jgi:hypothetical protein
MKLQSLGYIGIRTKSLEDWETYCTRFLGMQCVERSRSTLALRMDDRKQRMMIRHEDGEGPAFYGWEVEDAKALDALAAHLEHSGVKVAHGSRALASERRVQDLIVSRSFMVRKSPPIRSLPAVQSPVSAPGRSGWVTPS